MLRPSLRRGHRDFQDVWGEEIRVEPEAYFDRGERTLAFHVLHGRGRHSGVEVAMPIAFVTAGRWPYRQDRVVCPLDFPRFRRHCLT